MEYINTAFQNPLWHFAKSLVSQMPAGNKQTDKVAPLYLKTFNTILKRSNVGTAWLKKDGLNFVLIYFLNYARYVNDLHNIWKRRL